MNRDRLVYAWHTPDYAAHARGLISSLTALGEPFEVGMVPKLPGGWERNTLRKAAQLRSAMNRWPDRTIILLDADCVVRRSLAPLAEIGGDIGVLLMPRRTQRASVLLNVRSGTMVIRPTEMARQFVDEWCHLSEHAPTGAVDQHTLAQAIGRVPMLGVTQLGWEWCATEADDVPDPAILHGTASKGQRKTPKWLRRLYALRAAA